MTDRLVNDKPNKYSAYNAFGTQPLLQNQIFLKLLRLLSMNKSRSGVVDPHGANHMDNDHPTVAETETKFLYHSPIAKSSSRLHMLDIYTVGIFAGYFLVPSLNYLLLPCVFSLIVLPRRWVIMRNFCWHAKLVPSTEEVWLYKSGPGGVNVIVPVKCSALEKVDRSAITNELLWTFNIFDDKLIFRDQETNEFFVFDKQGVWNEDTLKHPLIY
uniref:Uncharacterized protein n=1 Tax=Strombidium rassoulzadegani TaxID=1082188 RepID=A0A7S3CJR2_9SPIT|mmetsp:Transcript_13285/g.22548  ORF Transcript_13285/g.22548 Transcript_13285/m.22548 type:complete len:214 (+) Transcript_13285:238-879(+)|eukprot:CAMPEP_0168621658 /NCGR_PEP_ID=MMETSP0449_2-20121227/7823_1 /TAXON_ID=1082188 /ORGANISM="Strombidium rassoulzadegani, Strain ras09" /LENGTH=213 /DNA_ID=CAMNT_0008662815 /DNA_START=162 /DNA_END=803 /DNA_ORIENTATION=-